MLNAGVIEPLNFEWVSPIVYATNPDGSLRFCVDYQQLSAVSKRN